MNEYIKSVFVSRNLAEDSPLYALRNKGYIINAASLQEITPVPFDEVPQTEWLFFYSRNAVRTFFAHVINIKFDATQYRIATLGHGTADELEKRTGISADFIGNGSMDDIAASLLHAIGSESVCFVRGKNAVQSIQLRLPNIRMTELITYNNIKKSGFTVPPSDILVFTSPLNVAAYYFENLVQMDQIVVAIGNSTAKALMNLGIFKVKVPEKPTEKSICDLIINLD